MTAQMPIITLDHLTPAERKIAAGIVATRGKNKDRLRASKPKVIRTDLGPKDDGIGYYHNWHIEGGETAYVWRMVAFQVSPKSQHHCMPCTADFDLPGSFSENRALAKELDAIVAKIVDAVPPSEWHGLRRWGQAYGVIGKPAHLVTVGRGAIR